MAAGAQQCRRCYVAQCHGPDRICEWCRQVFTRGNKRRPSTGDALLYCSRDCYAAARRYPPGDLWTNDERAEIKDRMTRARIARGQASGDGVPDPGAEGGLVSNQGGPPPRRGYASRTNYTLRVCAAPSCSALVGAGRSRCDLHRRDHRPCRTVRGYDEDWQKLRQWFMSQPDHQLCRACRDRGVVTLATDCDHVIPFRSMTDPRRLDPTNLQPLCKPCHSRKTRAGGGVIG